MVLTTLDVIDFIARRPMVWDKKGLSCTTDLSHATGFLRAQFFAMPPRVAISMKPARSSTATIRGAECTLSAPAPSARPPSNRSPPNFASPKKYATRGVLVNGNAGDVLYAGGYSGAVDGYQVNFRVPDGIAQGQAFLQLISAWIAGPAVTIPIQ
jgi:uncharacterized protein (TIGR03437 family)